MQKNNRKLRIKEQTGERRLRKTGEKIERKKIR
jgi:hypothetical protein